jgi:uncharacterized membrane protein
MTLYLIGLVIFTVIWLIVTWGAIEEWNKEKRRPKERKYRYSNEKVYDPLAVQSAAKVMLWALLGVVLIPIYPLAVVGAVVLGIFLLIRAGFRDLRIAEDPDEQESEKQ